jgi:hypothetical protein
MLSAEREYDAVRFSAAATIFPSSKMTGAAQVPVFYSREALDRVNETVSAAFAAFSAKASDRRLKAYFRLKASIKRKDRA